MNNVWLAFGLTAFAGLATGIGSAIAFLAPRTNHRFLSVTTGFSAGAMLYVSFVEIYQKGIVALEPRHGATGAAWGIAGAFFAGMLLIGLIDAFIPKEDNPHEIRADAELEPLHDPLTHGLPGTDADAASATLSSAHGRSLMRAGMFTALAIGIHNFPEGLATFLAALQDPSLGLAIAVAIALHNIPEGISVSIPIYYATGDRKKAFFYSILSGLAEPVGALVAYFGLRMFLGGDAGLSQEVMGWLFGGVAGIMVYISLDELLPMSRAYGKGHDSLLGLVAGMAVMALSLLLMK
ncbi:MAG: zinc transporter ZupT [Rhodothermales bacterium]|nr:zinc transporter ZupT [Rhodothermales bacterium]